jgi:hypothetical protein
LSYHKRIDIYVIIWYNSITLGISSTEVPRTSERQDAMIQQTLGTLLVLVGAIGTIALCMGADPRAALERIRMHEGTQAEHDRARLLKMKNLRETAWLVIGFVSVAGITLLLTG